MRGAIRYEPSALLHAASVLLQWSPRELGMTLPEVAVGDFITLLNATQLVPVTVRVTGTRCCYFDEIPDGGRCRWYWPG